MSNLTDRLEALNLSPTQLRLALQIVQCAELRSVTADRGGLDWRFAPPNLQGATKATVAALHRKTVAAGVGLLSPGRDYLGLTGRWDLGSAGWGAAMLNAGPEGRKARHDACHDAVTQLIEEGNRRAALRFLVRHTPDSIETMNRIVNIKVRLAREANAV
jgi:hypothetical protein